VISQFYEGVFGGRMKVLVVLFSLAILANGQILKKAKVKNTNKEYYDQSIK
jgi:hypothetical protein